MQLKSFLLKDKLAQYFPKMGTHKTADIEYSKAEFVKALDRFNEILATMNQRITFLCVGGGAMAMVLGARETTHDLDGMIQGGSQQEGLFYEIAEQVASELGMAKDWINLQVKPILQAQHISPNDFEASPKYHWSHLKMLFAKPGLMLALKATCLRIGHKDYRDVVSLLRILGIKSIEALQEEVSKYSDWNAVGNDELTQLKLAIAWAFPGKTSYEPVRQEALRRYELAKQQRAA